MGATNQQSESPALQRALRLIKNGYSAIPAGGGIKGKSPLIPSWEEFMPHRKDGTSGRNPTEDEVRAWWQQHPQAKVAVLCGWKGLAVIDIDDTKLADKLVEQFKNHAPLIRTPRGGLHIYCIEEETSKNGPLIKGVADIKAASGYVIAPPSEGYIKINDIETPLPIPNTRDYATVILAGLGYEVEESEVKENRPIVITEKITEGGRNDTLTSFAGSLKRNNNKITEQALSAAVSAINQAQCNPPLSEAEVSGIVRSVMRYDTPDEAWQPIIAFGEYDLPPFPLTALPPVLAEWAAAEAEATQTPFDLPALLTIGTIAAAVQRKLGIEINAGYTEPLNVYEVVGLDPGNRKSAVFRDATKPVYEWEQDQALAMKDDVAASQNHLAILKKRLKRAQDEAAKADDEAERREKVKIAQDLAIELSKYHPVVAPRCIVDDATTEKLTSLLCEQDEHIAMMSADSDIFAVIAGRYSKGEPNFNIYLKAHVGDSQRVDRVLGASGSLDHPALTLALTVQPSVLREMSKTSQFADRGLVARIWFVLPTSTMGHRRVETQPMSLGIADNYHRLVTALLTIKPDIDERGKIITRYLRLSDEARITFDYYRGEIEPKLSKHGELYDICSWASKLAGSVARLAGLLHLAEHYNQPEPWRTPVAATTLDRAIEIGEYLTAHARAAHGYMKADPQVENAKYLLEWIQKMDTPTFTKRDLYRRVRGKLPKMSDLAPPLQLLIEHSYLRERPQDKRGAGRKPSPVLEVHPDLLKKDGHNGQNNDDEDSSDHSGHQNIENKEDDSSAASNAPASVEDVQKIFSAPNPEPKETPPSIPQVVEQTPLFSDFPLYQKEHAHDYAMVTDKVGTFRRCKHCGEFPASEKKR